MRNLLVEMAGYAQLIRQTLNSSIITARRSTSPYKQPIDRLLFCCLQVMEKYCNAMKKALEL